MKEKNTITGTGIGAGIGTSAGTTEDLISDAKKILEANKQAIARAARAGLRSIVLDFQDVVDFNPELAEHLLQKPEDLVKIFEIAAGELGMIRDPRIRFSNLPETQNIKIRDIRARHLNLFVEIQGLVRQASDVRPRVVSARFECPACGSTISMLQIDNQFREPFRCSCGRKGRFKLLDKSLVDVQRIVLEESPEVLEGGEQPRRINVFLKEDLVEPKMERRTTPGSHVEVIGIIKEVPISLRGTNTISTLFDLIIEANNIIPRDETFEDLLINEEDEARIKEFAAKEDVYERMKEMIVPSIFGYDQIKEAVLLQLFGGIRKKKTDNTFSRGDIHVLLVGDPGVGKSVILQFVSKSAPKGRYIAGRAVSGAGLTATVVKDEFLRGWSLEAGALVLANKGILAIDELEKMDPQDRAAAHEALEQQQVSISKATIQATLRAETSVLAAANPKFGRFNPLDSVPKQIDIPPTLINRFDLIFPLRDLPERSHDEAVAEHVLKEHARRERGGFNPDFLRKYILYAKKNISPLLTEAALKEIKQYYIDLRSSASVSAEVVKPIPISARQLEGLVRLSEASARVRLSKRVTKEDAQRAIKLMHFSLKEVGFDPETQQIDIDRIVTGVSASQRSKIIIVKEIINRLEDRIGSKLIPVEAIKKEVAEKGIDESAVDEIIEKLKREGDVFEPRRNFIQKI